MVRHGYDFDPSYMYQPKIDPELDYFYLFEGNVCIWRNGAVRDPYDRWVWNTCENGYNKYEYNGTAFWAYREAAKKLWPVYPKELSFVDHIDRVRTFDGWVNLRRCSPSLNSLNQYREGTKGYRHETKEWLANVNAYRAKTHKKPLILKEPPRNKFIACLTYKGETYELGVHDNPEDATAQYLEEKEPFIRDRLRDIWSEFLFA